MKDRIRFLSVLVALLFVLSLPSVSAPIPASLADMTSMPQDTLPISRAFLPLVSSAGCETHTAAMALSTTATVLEVGEVITVTATIANVGCIDLGMPQYRLYVRPENEQPIFEPNRHAPILHLLGVHPGESDAAEFVLQAVGPGGATLSAGASFEVHLGYPRSAYWGGSSSDPLTITVVPAAASSSPTPCFATATPTPAVAPATATPTPTPAVVPATPTQTQTPAKDPATHNQKPKPTPEPVTPTLSVTPAEVTASLMVHKMAKPEAVAPSDVVTYTIVVMNDKLGGADPGTSVVLTDDIPAHTTYISGTASSGAHYDAAADRITWAGAVPQGLSVAVSFQVRVDDAASLTRALADGEIENVALVRDAFGRVYERRASVRREDS